MPETEEAAVLLREGYPPGVPCWVDTSQPDPWAAVSFYGKLFGWDFEDRMPAGSPGHYFVAMLDGYDVAAVASLPGGAPSTAAWNMYVAVESADTAAAAVEGADGAVVEAPFDVGDAGRIAVLADPESAVFCVWEPRGRRGARIVNAPGSWNFNELYARDPERALAFYRALFGWEAIPFGDTWMFTRPGYGDALEAIDPGLRERHEEAGAPEGFTDAVAWLVPDDEAPPHWGITFAVDGTDAMVERAVGLGATVVAPPHDAGPTRVATVRDPQGAVLTLNTYTPA